MHKQFMAKGKKAEIQFCGRMAEYISLAAHLLRRVGNDVLAKAYEERAAHHSRIAFEASRRTLAWLES